MFATLEKKRSQFVKNDRIFLYLVSAWSADFPMQKIFKISKNFVAPHESKQLGQPSVGLGFESRFTHDIILAHIRCFFFN